MSSKSSKKPKVTPAGPRSKAQIEEEYMRLSAHFSQAEYQARVYKGETDRLFLQLQNLNYEAAARNNLDREESLRNHKQAEQSTATTESKGV